MLTTWCLCSPNATINLSFFHMFMFFYAHVLDSDRQSDSYAPFWRGFTYNIETLGIAGYNYHDDVIKWKHFPRYWPFVRGIQQSPVNSPHKGQWRGALMFSSWGWWFETQSRSLWRRCNDVGFTRQRGKGGGVSLFISDDMYILQEIRLVKVHIEFIFIKIDTNCHTYFIRLVSFGNAMYSILDNVAPKRLYMRGDYNLNLLKHEIHHPTENFLYIMHANYPIHLINRFSRITRESSTLRYYQIITMSMRMEYWKIAIMEHYTIFHLLNLKAEKSTTDRYKLFE